jgi:hypothetical protein
MPDHSRYIPPYTTMMGVPTLSYGPNERGTDPRIADAHYQ